MPYTQAQLTALEEAIASGALTVKYADKEVTYRSLEDMRSIRDDMLSDIGGKDNSSGRRRFAKFSKGL